VLRLQPAARPGREPPCGAVGRRHHSDPHLLPQQTARLLLAKAENGAVRLPQRTLAAMLGARRPSLNKVLKDFEQRDTIRLGHRAIQLTDLAALRRPAS